MSDIKRCIQCSIMGTFDGSLCPACWDEIVKRENIKTAVAHPNFAKVKDTGKCIVCGAETAGLALCADCMAEPLPDVDKPKRCLQYNKPYMTSSDGICPDCWVSAVISAHEYTYGEDEGENEGENDRDDKFTEDDLWTNGYEFGYKRGLQAGHDSEIARQREKRLNSRIRRIWGKIKHTLRARFAKVYRYRDYDGIPF